MNEIEIFKNEEFGEVRTLVVNNEPMFVGKDVALALGYKDTVNALKLHVDEEDKMGWQITTPSRGTQNVIVINESGVYSLVFSSKLSKAKKFKHWVTSEVLPTIRKTGGYMVTKPDDTPEQIMARGYMIAIETIKRRDEQIAELKPDAEYTRTVLTSHTTHLTNVIAKEMGMSAVTFNKRLQGLGIQYKERGTWVLTSKYQDKGYTKTTTHDYVKSDGSIGTRIQTEWTEKGRMFLHQLRDNNKI